MQFCFCARGQGSATAADGFVRRDLPWLRFSSRKPDWDLAGGKGYTLTVSICMALKLVPAR